MKLFAAIIMLALPSFANGVEQADLVGLLGKIKKASSPMDGKTHIKYDPSLPVEYLDGKINRILSYDFKDKNIRGILKGKKLTALAIEEKLGDIDPIIFYTDNNNILLLINVTRLRDSGLAEDEICKSDFEKIDSWIDSLK